MTVADDILEQLQPVQRAFPDPHGTLDSLVQALTAPVEIVDQVARDSDTDAAWGAIRDPDTTPAPFLPWLGQHVGEYFTTGDDEATRRQLIRGTPRVHRGKTATMINRVKPTLTGTQTVLVFERVGGDQWAQTVLTRTSETPDPTATQAAVLYRKPAGLIITYVTSDSPIIDEWTRTINGVTVAIDSMTPTDVI